MGKIKFVMSIDEAVRRLIKEREIYHKRWGKTNCYIIRVRWIVERIHDYPDRHYATITKMLEDWWDNLESDKERPHFKIFDNYYRLELVEGMHRYKWEIYGNALLNIYIGKK